MAWLQLHLATTEQHADAFQAALENLGAVAVTLTDGADQPVFEPPPGTRPLWQNTVVSALFEQDQTPELILAALTAQGLNAEASHHETLEDQTWERAWMDDFSPMQFGERLWIIPSWSEAPDPQAVNLKLDPGLAFGTGHHPTTRMCLAQIEQLVTAGARVIDVGCGSGILSIASARVGASEVMGLDLDPVAIEVARQNAVQNQVSETLSLHQGSLPSPRVNPASFDLAVANISAKVVTEIAPDLVAAVRPGGVVIASGVLAENQDSVRDALTAAGAIPSRSLTEDGWVLLVATV